jgi:uroporphyrinogen-III synthase
MIPKIVPPLIGLGVLVTRPAGQAQTLYAEIERLGGTAHKFPTIAIEPLAAAAAAPCDLVVFASVNAVEHGKQLVAPNPAMKVAAIGKATASALEQAGFKVDYVPEAGFTSEALLAHPELTLREGMRVLIVRGEGGRELLMNTFAERGLIVETRQVYRRVRPAIEPHARDTLEREWSEGNVDIVTLTSVATLENLYAMLSERGRELLAKTPVLVVSKRIAAAARDHGLQGEIVSAPAPDDASIVGTLAKWHARART